MGQKISKTTSSAQLSEAVRDLGGVYDDYARAVLETGVDGAVVLTSYRTRDEILVGLREIGVEKMIHINVLTTKLLDSISSGPSAGASAANTIAATPELSATKLKRKLPQAAPKPSATTSSSSSSSFSSSSKKPVHRLLLGAVGTMDEDEEEEEEEEESDPLCCAIISKNESRVLKRLEELRGNKIGSKVGSLGVSPLSYAAQHFHSIIPLLIEHGADPNSGEGVGDGPALHWAVWNDRIENATALLAAKANVNVRDEDGCTPLHWVTSAEMAQLLLCHGACIDARDDLGRTPLNSILEQSVDSAKINMGVLRVLLDVGGADPNIPYHDVLPPSHQRKFRGGRTPLIAAVEYYNVCHDVEPLKELIYPSSGRARAVPINVNATDAEKWTALSWACWRGLDNVVSFLCTSTDAPLPANPCVKTKGGQTCFTILRDQKAAHKSRGDSKDMMNDMDAACRHARKVLNAREPTKKRKRGQQKADAEEE